MPNSEYGVNKAHAIKVAVFFPIGILIFLTLVYVPNIHFAIPCFFLRITGIPCPGCGLTRAFAAISRFDLVEAIRANILFLPLTLGGAAYFICALVEVFSGKPAIARFNSILSKKWIIALAVILTALSWIYNIIRM